MAEDAGYLRWLSLVALVVQASASGLLMRISRTMPGPAYAPSTVVLFTEGIKFLICSLLVCWEGGREHGWAPRARGVFMRCREILRGAPVYAVPALLYVCQPLLLITAATHMDAVSFQICNQIKIVPTALFSVMILGRSLSMRQWASLPIMATGVAFVTISSIDPSRGGAGGGGGEGGGAASGEVDAPKLASEWMFGLCCALAAGTSSGFASVYFEKHVKRSPESIWVKNLQLGVFGLTAIAAQVGLRDGQVREGGLLRGYTWATYALVASQSAGGLIVALVVKYADNILKGFAMALSVILSWLICIPLFGTIPTPMFLLGLALVCVSILMYNSSSGGGGGKGGHRGRGAREVQTLAGEGLGLGKSEPDGVEDHFLAGGVAGGWGATKRHNFRDV